MATSGGMVISSKMVTSSDEWCNMRSRNITFMVFSKHASANGAVGMQTAAAAPADRAAVADSASFDQRHRCLRLGL